jgi:hypothetical protein
LTSPEPFYSFAASSAINPDEDGRRLPERRVRMDTQQEYLRDMMKKRGYVLDYHKVAKRHGATKEEILELLELLVLPCGVPKFMLGYEAWTESFPVRRVEVEAP